MSKYDKIYNKIMNYPVPKDITFREIKYFLLKVGFNQISNDSHKIFVYKFQDLIVPVNIPAHNEGSIIKEVYIKKIREVIFKIEEHKNER